MVSLQLKLETTSNFGKTLHKEVIDSQAYSLLEPNDWLVVRNQEAGTAIPSDWSTYRTNVRSTAATMKGLIDDVTDVAVMANFLPSCAVEMIFTEAAKNRMDCLKSCCIIYIS